ncbi:hypothetical protein AMS68_005038 [Peltaster fructicola]|uniref:ML-like domain-containing protein n=1 Tax=Peltaster fructicola TaxID=286661 RepID=A0A6H0XXX9_9PEZI|nr:hypothetical protein AMS68_005038 [Peltaster fructicola]
MSVASPSSYEGDGALQAPLVSLLALPFFVQPAHAVFIEFDNCLSSSIQQSSPQLLQFVPLFVDARFADSGSTRPLQLTIYGNVTGKQFNAPYPPPDSPDWTNPNKTLGKITRTNSSGTGLTAQDTKFTFLDYTAYTAPRVAFCKDDGSNGTGVDCPWGPLFYKNASDPSQLHALSIEQDFNSSYAFTTLTPTVTILSGDSPPSTYGCISANITPDIGSGIRALLTWLPAVILILKAVATLAAAIYSPWGSADIFRWSSNYGRDEDLLRLVTPGFGDCLQYIQFVFLTGSLTLQYPGYYQPAVRQSAWSSLLFNESFVSHGPGTQSLVDGIYATWGSYGLETMSQLIGMTDVEDIWACMAIWLAVIAGIVILLCQLGFFSRWIYRRFTDTTEEDLRRKNLPFTLGNLIRLMFNFFILPIVALSFFQLVMASSSPISVVVMACVLLVIMILCAIWILRFIASTKPRRHLFDEMPTILLYGPLYNTYSDKAALFALVPVFITFMRGVAIGAVQPSGIAQIVILAICEVILILTLNAFQPFQGQTSMNLYHTVFSAVRLATVLLQIAFVPRLGVTEGPKGWVGYVILILHACVLVFGFFLNAAQTLLEVIARGFGVGGNSSGAVRGSILTVRMLKKRRNRPPTGDRQSLMSNAAMLRQDESDAARSRSMSASSQQLLNQAGHRTPSISRLSGFENFSSAGDLMSPTADTESTAYFGAAAPRKKSTDITGATDNFYRPPRQRRGTGDLFTPGAKSRQSTVSNDFPYSDAPGQGVKRGMSYGGSVYGNRDSPAAAYLRDRPDFDAEHGPRTDYAVREVDQYYRGEPLAGSGGPARKLKTGPADPQSPAANAQSWLQRMFFGVGKSKQDKEKSKGFEVVRSRRLPESQQEGGQHEDFEMVNSPPLQSEPYTDAPLLNDSEPQAIGGAQRDSGHKTSTSISAMSDNTFQFGFDEPADGQRGLGQIETHGARPSRSPSIDSLRHQHPGLRAEMAPVSSTAPTTQHLAPGPARATQHVAQAPTLSPIESVGGIDLPSRFNSRASTVDPGGDWLNAVDRLSWGDHSREAGLQMGTSTYAAPAVPERSTRRPPSVSFSPSQLPAINFASFHDEAPSPRDLHPFDELDRPTSFSVTHRRAADSITRNSFGAGQIASAAEVLSDDEK